MKKRARTLKLGKNSEKSIMYHGQPITMRRYIDFVWFTEYTKKRLELQKSKMYDEGTLTFGEDIIGILISTMQIELIQEFTDIDIKEMDYAELLDSDLIETVVWSFENYVPIITYYLGQLQMVQLQVMFMNLTNNLPSLDDLMGDINEASHILDNLPQEQKDLLLNIQLDKIIKDKDINSGEVVENGND